MAAIVVSIGRNVDDVPMDTDTWDAFKGETMWAAQATAETIYSRSEGVGTWEGKREDTYVVTFEARDYNLPRLREKLGKLAARYGQDAIALTVGTTDLVERAW